MASSRSISCIILLILSHSSKLGLCNRRLSKPPTHVLSWDPSVTEELGYGKIFSLEVHVNEYMDIFCPQYDADAPESEVLTFVIYNVSQESFEGCTRPQDARKIFECNTPSISKKLTTKFQKRSPNPLGFVFLPGATYFYIAFRNEGEIMDNPCANAMRMKITVKGGRRDHSHVKSTTAKVHPSTTKTPTTTHSTTTTSTTSKAKTTTTTLATSKKISISSPQKQHSFTTTTSGSERVTYATKWVLLIMLLVARFFTTD